MDSDRVAESLSLILKAAAADRHTLVLRCFLSRFGLDLSWGRSGKRTVIHAGFSQSHPASPGTFCWNNVATIEA